jgi:hypothetical protein
MVWIVSMISFLGCWPLLFSLEWWDRSLVRVVRFPNHLPLEGNDRIQNFWAITGDLQYPGNYLDTHRDEEILYNQPSNVDTI